MRWWIALACLAVAPPASAVGVALEATPYGHDLFVLSPLPSNATHVPGMPADLGGCAPGLPLDDPRGTYRVVLSGGHAVDTGTRRAPQPGRGLFGSIGVEGPSTLSWYVAPAARTDAGAPLVPTSVTVRVGVADLGDLSVLTEVPPAIVEGVAEAALQGPLSSGATYEDVGGVPVYRIDVALPALPHGVGLTTPFLLVTMEQEAPCEGSHTWLDAYSDAGHRATWSLEARAPPSAQQLKAGSQAHHLLGDLRGPLPSASSGDLALGVVPYSPLGPVAIASVRASLQGPDGEVRLVDRPVHQPPHAHGNVTTYIATEFGVHSWNVTRPLRPGAHALNVTVSDIFGQETTQEFRFVVEGDGAKDAPASLPTATLALVGAAAGVLRARREAR